MQSRHKTNLHVYVALFTVEALADAFIQRFTVKELARVHCFAARHISCSAKIKIATFKLLLLFLRVQHLTHVPKFMFVEK